MPLNRKVAGAACTGGDKAVRVRVAAHRAGIGTLLQGKSSFFASRRRPNLWLFIKILCKVQQNVFLLTLPPFVVRPTAPPSVTVLVPARRPSFSASAPFST